MEFYPTNEYREVTEISKKDFRGDKEIKLL